MRCRKRLRREKKSIPAKRLIQKTRQEITATYCGIGLQTSSHRYSLGWNIPEVTFPQKYLQLWCYFANFIGPLQNISRGTGLSGKCWGQWEAPGYRRCRRSLCCGGHERSQDSVDWQRHWVRSPFCNLYGVGWGWPREYDRWRSKAWAWSGWRAISNNKHGVLHQPEMW